jgi:hypothetical protein
MTRLVSQIVAAITLLGIAAVGSIVWMSVLTGVLYGSTIPSLDTKYLQEHGAFLEMISCGIGVVVDCDCCTTACGCLYPENTPSCDTTFDPVTPPDCLTFCPYGATTTTPASTTTTQAPVTYPPSTHIVNVAVRQIVVGSIAYRYFELQPFQNYRLGSVFTIRCPLAQRYSYDIPTSGYGVLLLDQVSNLVFSDPDIVFSLGSRAMETNITLPDPQLWSYRLMPPEEYDGVFFMTSPWSLSQNAILNISYSDGHTLELTAPLIIPTLVPVLLTAP